MNTDNSIYQKFSNNDSYKDSARRNIHVCHSFLNKEKEVCMSIVEKQESFTLKNDLDYIEENLIKEQKLGTSLITLLNDFKYIEDTVNKYIMKCIKLNGNIDKETTFISSILAPLLLELGNRNIYYKIIANAEIETYKKEVEKYRQAKAFFEKAKTHLESNQTPTSLLDYLEMVEEATKLLDVEEYENQKAYFEKSKNKLKNNKALKILFEELQESREDISFFKQYNLKMFTIDYLKKQLYILEEALNTLYILANYDLLKNKGKRFIIDFFSSDFEYNTLLTYSICYKIDNKYLNSIQVAEYYDKHIATLSSDSLSFQKYIQDLTPITYTKCTTKSIFDIIYLSLIEVIDKKITIKSCKNCKKLFITRNRSDEVYCDNPSPQNPQKSCRIYTAKRTYQEQMKEDSIQHEYNKITQLLRMRIRRSSTLKEKSTYNKKLQKIYKEFKEKRELYRNNELSETDLLAWLNEQQLEKRSSGRKKNVKGGDSDVK